MTRTHRALIVLLAGLLATQALAGQTSPVVDPFGDAVDSFGAGPPLLDFDVFSAEYTATTLNLSMTFHTPVASPSANLPNSVVGFLELDIDQSSRTGNPALQNLFSPPFTPVDLGVEFFVDLSYEFLFPGRVSIVDPESLDVVGEAPVTYTAFSLAVAVPLALIGNDDGLVDYTGVIGTFPQPTDASDVVGTSVPEPVSGALLLLGLLAASRRRV